MRIHCIIFDCDGTLVDSERLSMQLLVQMAADHDIALDLVETTESFAGVRLLETLKVIQRRHGKTLPKSFVAEFRARLNDDLKLHLQAMPGVHAALKKTHLPYCVVSNAPLEKIRLCLSVTGLADFFTDKIYSAYELGVWKPDPGLMLAAAKTMGFEPAGCVVIEDSMAGITAGLGAGMPVIAYNRPDFDDPRVSHLDHYRDLVELLKSLG